jgi:hypothetical protein
MLWFVAYWRMMSASFLANTAGVRLIYGRSAPHTNGCVDWRRSSWEMQPETSLSQTASTASISPRNRAFCFYSEMPEKAGPPKTCWFSGVRARLKTPHDLQSSTSSSNQTRDMRGRSERELSSNMRKTARETHRAFSRDLITNAGRPSIHGLSCS